MAGYANSKAKLAEVTAELARVKAELARYQREQPLARRSIVRREYDDRVIDELVTWSEEGLFLDEILANWGIDADTFKAWCGEHVALAEALGPSRARARASLLRTLRGALTSRVAFPIGLADRILAMIDREQQGESAGSEHLIKVELCPKCATADAQSAALMQQGIEIARPSATDDRSHTP